MADDGFSPEMLDAYFAALASGQSDEGSGGSSTGSPDVSGFLHALTARGIDPNHTVDQAYNTVLLLAEGQERARRRYEPALRRARENGYEELRQRIESMVEAEAQRHARRGMKRSGGIGSDAVASPAAPSPARSAVAPPLPVAGSPSPMPMTPRTSGAASPLPSAGELFQGVQRLGAPMSSAPAPAPPLPVRGIDSGAPQFSPILAMPPLGLRNLPGTAGGSGSVMGPMPPQPQPMPPTLSGMENPPELTREPFRPRGRVVANVLGAIGGGMGGGAVGGLPGAIAGGGMGSAGAGQLYDAAADWMLGTQERAPILSGQTAFDAAAGAIPAAGPAIGAGMRAAGRGASEVASAAMRRPTMSSALASGMLGGAGMAATSGQTQEVDIPAQFRPVDRDEYFRRNRKTSKSLADLQTEAENAVRANPAYQGLVEDRQTTRATRMIEQARANAKKTFDDQKAELSGEDDRLDSDYNKYKASLKADLDAYFSGRAAEAQAAKDRLANTPFRQRHPDWASALPAIGFGIAAGIPFVGRSAANAMTWLPRSASRNVDAATARAEAATTAADMRNFNIAAGEINNALAARPPSILNQPNAGEMARATGQAMWPATKAGIAGGPLVAEASMFPDQWDMYNLPPGQAQSDARRNALNPLAYGERAALGALTAAGGYKLPDVFVPRRQPNWARAEAAAKNPPQGGGGRGGGQGGGGLPSLVERRARANPDDPRGDWVPRSEPVARGVTSYVSREGRNEVFLDAGGNWQRRLPNGQTQFLDSRASRALDSGRPPQKYRRVSQAEPGNLLAAYG